VIDYAGAQTGIDTLSAQIETVELPGAAPKQFVKATTISKTLVSGIGNDIDLPIGNPILGILLFATTIPAGTSYACSIQKVKCLVDNMESHYSETNWESLYSEMLHRLPYNPANDAHVHGFNGAAPAYDTTLQPESGPAIFPNYAYLDFDPVRDGSYALETEGKSRVHLRITAGASDGVRVLPVELIKVAPSATA
jgi:hypothetical protein